MKFYWQSLWLKETNADMPDKMTITEKQNIYSPPNAITISDGVDDWRITQWKTLETMMPKSSESTAKNHRSDKLPTLYTVAVDTLYRYSDPDTHQ